jgi:hypothetical protein
MRIAGFMTLVLRTYRSGVGDLHRYGSVGG